MSEKVTIGSYSQINCYTSCPKHWFLKYKEKWDSPVLKASLFYGNAVEAGIIALLENNPAYLTVAHENWISQTKYNHVTLIQDNDNIAYAHADFDEHVLTPTDKDLLKSYINSLELNFLGEDPVQVYKEVSKIKKNPYKNTTDNMMKYFNKCSWLSLYRKLDILVETFKQQVLPRIKKVHAVQKESSLESADGKFKVKGFIDFIFDFEGYDKPIIFDLKTSAGEYSLDKIELSEQLAIYLGMEGFNYNTNLAGYIVLNKNIAKEVVSYCKKCGTKKEGRHKTCNMLQEGKRCNGEWEDKIELKPEAQVLVASKTDFQIDSMLEDYSHVLKAMKEGIVYKNINNCTNWFGGPCPYLNKCFKDSTEGLVKK